MITIPNGFDLNAREAADQAKAARERLHHQTQVLMGYLNQVRAAHDLGVNSLTTTCLIHETDWLAQEFRDRQFEVEAEVHLMHGQLKIRWPEQKNGLN